ncbi:MAG: FkbM family methyltransferase [bacterium]|nr:FkbM family methyltransferase [bacterium]
MGVVRNKLNRSFSKVVDPTFYGFLRLAFLFVIKGKNKGGKTRVMGRKVHYNDAKALMGMYQEIVHSEHYKFKPKSSTPVIIDCGANIGISVLYFDKVFSNAEIIAVEADPEITSILKRNLTENNCNAEVIEKALWSKSGETLSFGQEGADSSSIYSLNNVIQVETIGLDEILERYEHIDLLKIDIEGAELEVIKSCTNNLSKVDYIFVEFHSFPDKRQNLEVILSTIANQGFRYKILPARREVQPFMQDQFKHTMDVQLNIFFYRDMNQA